MRTFWIAAMLSVAATGLAQANEAGASEPRARAPASAEARIPFVNHGGINDWRADGSDAIYIQDNHRQWYRATFMGSCIDLPFAEVIGIETRGGDTFDRFGTVIVRGHRCAVSSFVKSDAPPKKKVDRKKHRIEQVKPAGPTA